MSNRQPVLKESPKPEWPCLPRLVIGVLALVALTVALFLGGVFA